MTFSVRLGNYLANYLQDLEVKNIFEDVIGSSDTKKLSDAICRVAGEHLQADIVDIVFVQASVGVVLGLALANQKYVVLKIFSPKIAKNFLDQMNYLQNVFYQEHFPAPQVLSPIFAFNHTHAGFYEFIAGSKENGHKAIIRLELAQALAKFANIRDKHCLPSLKNIFQQDNGNKLWPPPHNILFDYQKTASGAGWIAKKAMAARKILRKANLPKKLAHSDWGIKNAVFKDNRLQAIFDWDSLGAMSELEMVGGACAHFTADWDSGVKITPSPYEGREFVRCYLKYRQLKLTAEEYEIVSAAADYVIAIMARLEHAHGILDCHYQALLQDCQGRSFLFA